MTRQTEHTSAQLPGKRRRLVLISAALLAILALLAAGGYWWLRSSASVHHAGVATCADVPTTTTTDPGADPEHARAGICAAIEELGRAWAEHDAEAYGAVFTDDATYVTFAGTHYAGREDIVRSHAALYDGPLEGTRLTDAFLDLRVLTDDVAILTTRGDTYSSEVPDQPTKVQTYTLVRQDGQWRIAAFQNTQRKPVMEQLQFRMMPDTRPGAEG